MERKTKKGQLGRREEYMKENETPEKDERFGTR